MKVAFIGNQVGEMFTLFMQLWLKFFTFWGPVVCCLLELSVPMSLVTVFQTPTVLVSRSMCEFRRR